MTNTTSQKFGEQASAADVARNFGRYKELAQRAPVHITSHGRDSLVLISAAEYARLKALDDRLALYAHELPDDLAKALDTAEPPQSSKAFDHELEPR